MCKNKILLQPILYFNTLQKCEFEKKIDLELEYQYNHS